MAWNDENISPSVTQETDAALVSLGQRGCACVFNSGGVPVGNYAAVQCLSDCVFSEIFTIDGPNLEDSPFFPFVDNGFTFPAGTIIYGRFVSLEASIGAFIAYKA